MSTTYSAGIATAYGAAVRGGYTGTYQQFCADMAALPGVVETLEGITASATTLPAGSDATASYSDGDFEFGIPKGDKGDKGDTGATGATGNGIASIAKTSTVGLVDTYTITFTDGTITTFEVTNGQDGEVTEESLEETLEDYAKVDGSYSSMTVGNAEQLLSTVGVTDSVPYLFRTSGGNVDIGDRETDKLVGGTVAWNQLMMYGDFSDVTGWNGSNSIKTVADNILTAKLVAVTAANQISRTVQTVIGHKYFVICSINPPKQTVCRFQYSSIAQNVPTFSVSANVWTTVATVFNCIVNNGILLYYDTTSQLAVDDEVQFKNFMAFDLTQMFGSTIADYIYALETANAGDGIAWFRKYFPKDYYAYNAGQLMSVKTSEHKMTGFNQWDKSTDSANKSINNQGQEVTANNFYLSDYIKVIPNTNYYFKDVVGSSYAYASGWYDADKNFIMLKTIPGGYTVSGVLKSPENACYVRATRRRDVSDEACISIHWDGERDGEYEAYEEHSYALDSDLELRGIPKLDASNNLYYDGDTYESDGTVTRRYGEVTLNGTESWSWDSNNAVAKVGITGGVITSASTQYNAYTFNSDPTIRDGTWVNRNSNLPVMGMYYGQSALFVKSNDFTSADDADTYFTNHPTTVIYELATPTTESADPYTNPQIVNDWGTEEYVDTRDVPIPVGHETLYQVNLKAKLEMSPNSPSGDGDYIVRQTNGINEYVQLVIPNELPTMPSEDGTYTLKVTVASGVSTLTWEAEA